MPKRMCPSEYDYFPQYKKHISDKIGTMAMDTQNMQVIYNKTMNKLFKGARITTTAVENHPTPSTQYDTKHYKQTFLNSHCQLQNLGPTVAKQPNHTCGSCQVRNNPSQSCSFCEKPICGECTKACVRCAENFCMSCSSERFNNYADQYLCLSCR